MAADNLSGSAAILTHLVEDHGKRRIYHVDGPPGMPDTAQRRSGLLQVLRDHPAARLAGATHGSNHVESGLAAGQRILAECRDQLPDAVVAANDQMAIGVLRSLTAAGVRVPEQVAVAGFDDIFPARLWEPPLTTVHQPMGMLGERACDRLLKRIATPSLPAGLRSRPKSFIPCRVGDDPGRTIAVVLGARQTLWVPTIHPCWSGGMTVLVAELVPSADVDVRDPLRIGNRFE